MYLVFDVNETLLDLASLDPLFEQHLGSRSYRQAWFDQVLKSAFVSTITGPYSDFGVVARSALQMVANRMGQKLSAEAIGEILGQMRRLSPHPDVLPAITNLKDAGFRMAALTNSPPAVAQAQLDHAGISPLLETVLSVDASKSLKPAQIVYDDAAQKLGTSPESTCLIAAHAWDIAGAMCAGWQGAFVERTGKIWNPLFESPTFTGGTIADIADQLIAHTAS